MSATGYDGPTADDIRKMTPEEAMVAGAEVDGVRIVHRRDRFPIRGTKAEKRTERAVALTFFVAALAGVGFIVAFIVAPWHWHLPNRAQTFKYFTPLLGGTLAIMLIFFGLGLVLWGKWLMPEEEVVQDRHDEPEAEEENLLTEATLAVGLEDTGIARRSSIKFGLLAAGGALASVPLVALLGAMIKKPGTQLLHTLWDNKWAPAEAPKGPNGKRMVPIVYEDFRQVSPDDLEPGGLATVFPGVRQEVNGKNGVTDASSPTLLIRLRPTRPSRPRRARSASAGRRTTPSTLRSPRSARTPAAPPRSTSSRPADCSARATSRSSRSSPTPVRCSVRPPGVFRSCPSRWSRRTASGISTQSVITMKGKAAMWFEERLKIAGPMRKQLNKVFPDHWSFMMGEIALYSFIILLLTGTYLSFFFDPSMKETVYHGRYVPMQGIEMSRAYASTLDLTFDVRGGLVVRQIHHWAALLFLAAMIIHMFRVFFTGAFRKPRELNWIIGLVLIMLGIFEGFMGYSLPDDLLSGTGLRIADAILLSIPVVGTWLAFLLFGGQFPGELIIERFYIIHVLLFPALILALIGAHLALVVRQKHTQFGGYGRDEKTVAGERVYPIYAAKAGGFFFIVFGVCCALGGLAQINPVWLFGPYTPSQVSAGSQPDWYMMFLDGSTRLFPSWEIRAWGHTIPAIFWPTVVLPGILVTLAALYPFIEAKMTGDRASHNTLQRPRDVPVRTSLGAMAIAFYVVLFLSGGNDIIAKAFDISLNAMTWGGRIALLVVPPIAYLVAYRVCLGLQRHDREVLEHGMETGIIKVLPTGEFIEVHQPLGPVDHHGHGELTYAGTPVPKRMNQVGASAPLRHIRGFFWPVTEKPEIQAELDALEDAEERAALESGRPAGEPVGLSD